MSLKGFTKGVLAAAVAVSALTAQPVSAQSLGKLNIIGSVDIYQTVMGGGQNVVIDFLPMDFADPDDGAVYAVTPNTGVFAGLAPFTPGLNIDFVFGPGAVPPSTTTPVDFLTIGGYTFTATAFGPGSTIPGYPFDLTLDASGTPYATLSVRGYVTGGGLTQPTSFTGAYSTQFPEYDSVADLIADIEAGEVVPSSISASFVVTAVPEPSTYALMATGLLVIAGIGMRRRTS